MSTRKLPYTISGCKSVMKIAEEKHKSVLPADSAISPAIATRLNADRLAFNAAISGVESAQETLHTASAFLRLKRRKLFINVNGYFKSINNGIDLEVIPPEARAFFGLDITNSHLPDLTSDAKLVNWADEIELGDPKRILAGGIVFNLPTVANLISVHADFKDAFTIVSTAQSGLTNAQIVLNELRPEIHKIILRTWNEIETTFSELDASTARAASRPWSVLYVSVGKPTTITGKCTDSITGLPIPDVTIHLEGVANKVVDDITGNYSLGTSQYGDLELMATAKDYINFELSFSKEDGVDIVVNIVMVHI